MSQPFSGDAPPAPPHPPASNGAAAATTAHPATGPATGPAAGASAGLEVTIGAMTAAAANVVSALRRDVDKTGGIIEDPAPDTIGDPAAYTAVTTVLASQRASDRAVIAAAEDFADDLRAAARTYQAGEDDIHASIAKPDSPTSGGGHR